jgi:hypothetical protein
MIVEVIMGADGSYTKTLRLILAEWFLWDGGN